MEDLIKMSQNINSTSAMPPPEKQKVSKMYVDPPPKAKKATIAAATAVKDINADLMKEQKNRWRLMINGYLESKKFRHLLEDFEKIDLKKAEKITVDQMKEILDAIRARIVCKDQREFVDTMFMNGVTMISGIAAVALSCPEYNMIPNIIKDDMESFDGDLEQISIELDPSWVPGPEKRIAMKIANIIMDVHRHIEANKQKAEVNSKKNDKEKDNNK